MAKAAPPWQRAYPPGLAADAELAAFPVQSIVQNGAAQWGDKPAIDFYGRTISYIELDRMSDAAARRLVGLGIRPGDRIALLLPNTPWHPIAFFGVLKAGGVVVHLSPLDAPRVVEHKLRDSGARVLVTTDFEGFAERTKQFLVGGLIERLIVGEDDRWSGIIPNGADSLSSGPSGHLLFGGEKVEHDVPAAAASPLGERVARAKPEPGEGAASLDRDNGSLIVHWAGLDDEDAADALPSPAVDDLALLQYTGGTTGMPKAAMLTHRNLSAAVSSYDLWFKAHGLARPGEERILLYLPLFHIYGLTAVMLRGLQDGQKLLLRTRFDPLAALDEIEAGATVLPGVPTMWIAIASTPGFEKRDLSSLRHAASGGAPMPVEVARRLVSKTGVELLGGWGMSETAPAGTNLPPGRGDKLGSIGVPLPGVSVRVVALDDPRRPLGPGETGELAVNGPNVTAGYHNRRAENASCFIDGWFLTGDIGHMDEDGFFFIVDRKKDMIISGGFNVYPQMVEQALYEHPDVEEVLVIGIPDAYRGEAAKAFVKLRASAPRLSLEELRAFLKGRVGPHEMPAALEIRDALPRTPVGKLSKLELKQEEAARLQAAKAS